MERTTQVLEGLGVAPGVAIGPAYLLEAGAIQADTTVRRESRALLFGFTEYHLERRMKSLPILAKNLGGPGGSWSERERASGSPPEKVHTT